MNGVCFIAVTIFVGWLYVIKQTLLELHFGGFRKKSLFYTFETKTHTFLWLWKSCRERFLYVQKSEISDPLFKESSCRSYLCDLFTLTEWKSFWNETLSSVTLSQGRELYLLDGKCLWLLPQVWAVPYIICCNFPDLTMFLFQGNVVLVLWNIPVSFAKFVQSLIAIGPVVL